MKNWNWPLIGATVLSLTIWVLLLFWLFGCGSDPSTETWPADQYVAGIPVAGNVLPDERMALSRLSTGILALSYSVDNLPTVIFIRSPGQRVPEMCGSDGCCDIWADCPDALGVPERVEGEGFSGLQRGDHIYISRIGDRASALDELLAHEFAHWFCDCGDGSRVLELEHQLMEAM